jgi:hypothetical protein
MAKNLHLKELFSLTIYFGISLIKKNLNKKSEIRVGFFVLFCRR